MLYDPKWEVQVDNDVVRALKTAKQIISDPERWTCGEYARNADGAYVSIENSSAVSFCSVGALARASNSDIRTTEDSAAYRFLKDAANEQGHFGPHYLNDSRVHAKAMAMFDRAIELASVA